MKITDTELAYMAGLFDGEGAIWIAVINKAYKNPAPVLQMSISNNNRDVLDWVSTTMGIGKIYKESQKYLKNTKTIKLDCHRLHFYGMQAGIFLSLIKPYVRIKIKQVEIALSFLTTYVNYDENNFLNRNKTQALTPENIKKRYEMMSKMRELNSMKGR